jgi:hypothetical protein
VILRHFGPLALNLFPFYQITKLKKCDDENPQNPEIVQNAEYDTSNSKASFRITELT